MTDNLPFDGGQNPDLPNSTLTDLHMDIVELEAHVETLERELAKTRYHKSIMFDMLLVTAKVMTMLMEDEDHPHDEIREMARIHLGNVRDVIDIIYEPDE